MERLYRSRRVEERIWKGKRMLDLVLLSYKGNYPGKTDRPREIFKGPYQGAPMSGSLIVDEMARGLVHYLDIFSDYEEMGKVEIFSVRERRRKTTGS